MRHAICSPHRVWQWLRPVAPWLIVTLLAFWPMSLFAATINVTGACTLPDAITAANTDSVTGSCPAGSGDDLLDLQDPLYSLATGTFAADGLNATPSIATIITIQGNGAIIERSGLATYRLFHVAANGNLTLDNVIVRNGLEMEGGAIFNLGTLTVLNSTLVTNTAQWGGALANYHGATAHFDTTTIISNTATVDGGGVYNWDGSSLRITNTSIISNVASGVGGGVVNYQNSRFVTDDYAILGNIAGSNGGGVYSTENSFVELKGGAIGFNRAINGAGLVNGIGSTATISNTNAYSNTASGNGGVVYNWDHSVLTATNNLLLLNLATNGGVIYNETVVTMTLANTPVYSNTALAMGGAIYGNANANLHVVGSNIYRNRAGSGGAFSTSSNSTLSVIYSTIYANRAEVGPGGAFANQLNSTIHITTSNVYSNVASEGGAIYNNVASTATLYDVLVSFNQGNIAAGILNDNNSDLYFDDVFLYGHEATIGAGIRNLHGSRFHATDSKLTDNHATDIGGALSNEDTSTASITDTLILTNTADNQGGGIYNANAVTLTAATVSHNAADQGGGLYSVLGTITILTDTTFFSNTATSGAGLYAQDTTVAIYGSRFAENLATADGGGLYLLQSPFTLSGSDVTTNTASFGGGLHLATTESLVLDSNILANTATTWGGGLFLTNGSETQIVRSPIANNTALQDGGGLFNTGVSTATLNNTDVTGNVATNSGGGIANSVNSRLTIAFAEIQGNQAAAAGGIYHDSGLVEIALTAILSNTATSNGGGIYNLADMAFGGVVYVFGNQAIHGAGIINDGGTLTATAIFLQQNNGSGAGAGLFNTNGGVARLNQSLIQSNTATTHGAGIYNDSVITLTATNLISNVATEDGGAFYMAGGEGYIDEAQILGNVANDDGGAVHQTNGVLGISISCIVNNGDVAVNYAAGNDIEATGNWWGAPDGPSGVGSGSGDSVSANVLFDPFVTTQPGLCPTRIASLAFDKVASISDALPGQPLDFTLFITNTSDQRVSNVYVTDTLPAEYGVADVEYSDPGITFNGSSYLIPELDAAEGAWIRFEGHVASDLTAATTLENSATLTHAIQSTLTATVEVAVTLPAVAWSQANYAANEASGSFTATVVLSAANPYTTVTVQAVYTDSATGGLAIQAVEEVTFLAGQSSAAVVIPIPDDGAATPRTIELSLQSPVGAVLGATPNATISVTDDDAQAGIEVAKSASTSSAEVGDTITYTYRITNSGNVTLTTISALDDMLGEVTGLAGELAMDGTRTAVLTYVVQPSDLPGPLVNTVTVTGTDSFGGSATGEAQAIVTVSDPTSLPETEQPQQPTRELFLPGIKVD